MSCEFTNRDILIDEYINGELSKEERTSFEEHLLTCDLCARELWLREEMVSLIRNEKDILFSDYLGMARTEKISIIKSLAENLRWRKKQNRWIYATGIAFILFVIFFGIYNIFSPDAINEFTQIEPFPYYKPHILNGASEAKGIFFDGMEYYKQRKYRMATERLESALKIDPQLNDAYFYLGLNYLILDQPGRAIEYLKIAADRNQDSEKEHWYLAHAYLRKDNQFEALQELSIVVNLGQERYAEKAILLIKKLQK